MTIRQIWRWSRPERMLRVACCSWDRAYVGDGSGYSARLSLALRPTLFRVRAELHGWIVTILGVRVHYQRSYGGRLA